MKQSRLAILEKMQTGIARKVLQAVPISEEWNAREIGRELGRLGHNPNFRILEGCLNTLVESGLVTEKTKGMFRRVAAKEKEVQDMIQNEITPRVLAAVPEPKREEIELLDPLEQLFAVAKRLRTAADEIEAEAMRMQEKMEQVTKDQESLNQLRTLLKKL